VNVEVLQLIPPTSKLSDWRSSIGARRIINMSAQPRTGSINLSNTGVKGATGVPLYTSPHSQDEAISLDKIQLALRGMGS
jgi:hypothetical protein